MLANQFALLWSLQLTRYVGNANSFEINQLLQ